MYSAAICVGTVATFGAPIGGVIFAMELTSTYYMVGNLWKCFLAAMSAIIVYHLMFSLPPIKPPQHTKFTDVEINHEIIFFVILGLISAGVAGLFNHVLTKLIFLRVKLKNPFISNRWKWCATVSLFISFIGFPIHYMHFSEKKICDMFFSLDNMEHLKGKYYIRFNLNIDGDVWKEPL
jgi:H+/Cl- antiporter ClcA